MRKHHSLPQTPSPELSLAPIRPPASVPPPPSAPGFDDLAGAGLPLSHYVWLFRTNLLRMLAFVVLVVLVTLFVTLRLTPIYESTATLYIDRAAQTDIVGKDNRDTSESSLDSDSYIASQMKLLQSDSVVRPLSEKFNLLEREKQVRPGKDEPQKIARIQAAPIVLKGLRITRPPNTFVLQISYRSSDPEVATEVANGIAQSYIEHIYNIRFNSSASLSHFLTRQLDELRAKMEASAARLATLERELNVINPEEKTNILSARLLQLNQEYTRVQGERAQAQSLYESLNAGSVAAALGSTQSDDLRSIMKRLNEERQHFADIKARYGVNHPEYARAEATVAELEAQVQGSVKLLAGHAAAAFERARNQETLIKKDVDETKAQYDQLNLRSFDYQRAKQEAEADRALYLELEKKIREGQINSGFQNDMVRLADGARPGAKPVFPSYPLNLALAFGLGSLLACAAVILVDRIDTTVKNPEEVSRGLNVRVLGSLPILKKASMPGGALVHHRSLPANGNGNGNGAARQQIGPFEEAVRTIRNSILLTDFDRRLRSILMTSATPSEGKSTVAAHLAIAHAEQRGRTLLIDGDMRRPSIHRLFRISNAAGLATVLEENASWRDLLIQPIPEIELYILPAGPASRRATDLVGLRLTQLIEDAAGEFDLIFLDSPPLLGFPEPLQMAAATDGVVVVARAGQTDRTAVATVLDLLRDLRANVVGVILNELRKENSRSYYYYGGNYSKYYAARTSPDASDD